MSGRTFAIIGGDKRNISLAEMLFRQGHNVKLYGFVNYKQESFMQCKQFSEMIKNAQYIIGPMPCSNKSGALNTPYHNSKLHPEDVFKHMNTQQVFIAGCIKASVYEIAKKYNINIIDLLDYEELQVSLAIPTAEGAIKIAIEETDITLHGSHIMIIGYGHVGVVICRMLQGMGAKVSVVVENTYETAVVKSAGYNAILIPTMDSQLCCADVIINTKPTTLLDKHNMGFIRQDTLVIDLAHSIDPIAGRKLGLKTLYANALLGKVAPITTAGYMLDTIRRIV